MSEEPTIRPAEPADLSFMLDLQNRLNYAVGVIPRGAILERIETRRILTVTVNGELAGFLNYTHRRDRVTHVSQLAIDPELWRQRFGTLALARLMTNAVNLGQDALTLKCAEDLDANSFWETQALDCWGQTNGRRRTLIIWGKVLNPRLEPSDISIPLPNANSGIPHARTEQKSHA